MGRGASIGGAIIGLVLCMVVVGLVGHGGGHKRPMELVIGIDTSGSARPLLSRFVLGASKLAAHLEPERDVLAMYRVDETVQEFYRERVHGGREATLRRLLVGVEQMPMHNSTMPEKFWREALLRSKSSHSDYLFVLFSDGDNDDMKRSSSSALKELAQRMAELPGLYGVAIVGVTPANRAYWQECFGSTLGDRLIMVGGDDPSVDSLLEILDKRQ